MVKMYRVKIGTPNKMIVYRNRVIRTPAELKVTEKELLVIKMKIKADGINDYSIVEIIEGQVPFVEIPVTIGKEFIVEKQEDDVQKENEISILQRLLSEESE